MGPACKVLTNQRQVEKPLAGIIQDLEPAWLRVDAMGSGISPHIDGTVARCKCSLCISRMHRAALRQPRNTIPAIFRQRRIWELRLAARDRPAYVVGTLQVRPKLASGVASPC